jgi:hypothetical protein
MTAKGGVISFRVDEKELACIREKAKALPRKANGRFASSGDVVHRLLSEALQQVPGHDGVTLEDVIRAIAPDWSGKLPAVPTPVKASFPEGKTPVDLYLERQR